MTNKLITLGILAFVVVIALATYFLKPIIFHENEYKVVFANTSEHNVTKVRIYGAGEDVQREGPIRPGHVRDFIFEPKQDGVLRYSIVQHGRELAGVVNANLHAGDTGEVFVVLGELSRVRIKDKLDL